MSLHFLPNRDSVKLNMLEKTYLNDYISKYGLDRCLNLDLNPKAATLRVGKSKHTYYVYDPFGKFINMYTCAEDCAKAIGCTCISTIFKVRNGWKGYEQYKRFRIKRNFVERIEPLSDTYVIFDSGKIFKFCTSAKEVVDTLQIRGGGARTRLFQGGLVKKRYKVVSYSDYIKVEHVEALNKHTGKGFRVTILDAKTEKPLKTFQSFSAALRFLEYPIHFVREIEEAIENKLVYLNYKWRKE